jgi:multidrug efflux pump
MNLSAPFVRRPIATVLLTIGVALAGIAGFFALPVSPLPQVDYPVISVSATIPGASPDTMATSVATPLERRLGTISGVNEMTSSSSTGTTRVTLQFDLSRNIDGAAREVQAAINASRVDLPASLRSNPTYRKANPSDAPIIILALTSKTRTPGQIYQDVSNIVSQRLSQVQGVGDVEISGGSLPAVRVEVSPFALNRFGVGLEDVRAAIQASNANRPKGAVEGEGRRLQIYTQTPGLHAADYRPMVVAWRNGAAVRLGDVAQVVDGVENARTLGLFNGEPAVIVLVTRQPGANVIETVDALRALLPELRAQLPADVSLEVANDSTHSIRASLREIELTLVISVILVVVVVAAFLRSLRATLIPAVATVVALLGTFGVMLLLGFSLNNLSLMALTVATGFVVDDAIVVLENTSRHIEAGMGRFEAALLGAREVGFTVLSISLSLVAVFIPLLFMEGQVGRLFREFAVTLSAAVLISLVVSLTTTPMMCAWLLSPGHEKPPGRLARLAERGYRRVLGGYARSLDWALASRALVLAILLAVIGLNVYLFSAAPKGFFPQQDTGQLNGGMRADQSISSQAMAQKLRQVVGIVHADPAVDTVVGFVGGSRPGGGFMFVNLKPQNQRSVSGQQVISRLRPQLASVPGLTIFLNPVQDVRAGGRQTTSTYQYTLQSDNLADLRLWATRLSDAMKTHGDVLVDVDTDQADNGVESYVQVDRDSASRLGVTATQVDNALYDAFGQRQVATIYDELNQYHVILEWAPRYTLTPNALADLYVTATGSGGSGTGSTTAGTPTGTTSVPTTASTPGITSGTTSGVAYAPSLTSGIASSTTSSTASAAPATPTTVSTAGGGTGGGAGAASLAPAAATGATTGTQATTSGAAASTGVIAPPASVSPVISVNPASRDAATGSALANSVTPLVPLSAVARFRQNAAATAVNHQDTEIATTISFNLVGDATLNDARRAISQAEADVGLPTNVRGGFQGTALQAQRSQAQQAFLIVAAIVVIYIVLGILYESLVHPITVLSTLPAAGVGAVLALLALRMQFSVIALIGVFLLIGIVKKNAILIIDFALEAERGRGLSPLEAVREASLLRFRPILMTTLAAALGALPLAIGFGEGAELRQPLGVAIIGGLIASQLLTLITTPVVYLLLDRLRRRSPNERRLARAADEPAPVGA